MIVATFFCCFIAYISVCLSCSTLSWVSGEMNDCSVCLPVQISASGEKVYHDAYTLQQVESMNITDFNYVAGMVPFLLNQIIDVRQLRCHSVLHLRDCSVSQVNS